MRPHAALLLVGLMLATGCSFPPGAHQAAKEVAPTAPTQSPGASSMGSSSPGTSPSVSPSSSPGNSPDRRFAFRVASILDFRPSGYRVVPPPETQSITVPRQWTGVSVTNQSEYAVHNAAQFVFVSTSDPQDVILVDMMYVPSLQSRGFMHTMWFDQHRATERKACSGCGRFYMIEFYESQFAYSVVELSPKGDGIYGFVKELMSLLETVQQREGSAK